MALDKGVVATSWEQLLREIGDDVSVYQNKAHGLLRNFTRLFEVAMVQVAKTYGIEDIQTLVDEHLKGALAPSLAYFVENGLYALNVFSREVEFTIENDEQLAEFSSLIDFCVNSLELVPVNLEEPYFALISPVRALKEQAEAAKLARTVSSIWISSAPVAAIHCAANSRERQSTPAYPGYAVAA